MILDNKDKSCFAKCSQCKKIYQIRAIVRQPFLSSITGKNTQYIWAKDQKNIQSVICDRCGEIIGLGGSYNGTEFCKKCDRIMTVHEGCPRCGCRNYDNLGLFDALPHEYF